MSIWNRILVCCSAATAAIGVLQDARLAEGGNDACQLQVEWADDPDNPGEIIQRLVPKDAEMRSTANGLEWFITYEFCPNITCIGGSPQGEPCETIHNASLNNYHCSCGGAAPDPDCETYFTATSTPYGGNYYHGVISCAGSCGSGCSKVDTGIGNPNQVGAPEGSLNWTTQECQCP